MADRKKTLDSNALTLATLEERINTLGRAVLGSENYGKLMHGALTTRTSVKRAFSDQMARNLHFYNLPTQDDLVSLAEQCNRIEERVVRMELGLNRLIEQLAGPSPATSENRAPRTRKPKRKAPIPAKSGKPKTKP